MAKRLKRVYSSADQVIHLWANQSQSDARCKNVFFEGKKIYSYGYHYLMGELHEVKGVTIALINDCKYSSTTNKHKSWTYSAVSHMPRFYVDNPNDASFYNIELALIKTQDILVNQLMSLFNSRSFYNGYKPLNKDSWLMENINEFNKTCKTLGYKQLNIDVTQDFIDLANEHVKRMILRKAELQSPEMLAKKQAKQLNKLSDSIIAWRKGGPLTSNLRNLNPQLIRLYNDTVQTSRGAEVPYSEARALLDSIIAKKAKLGHKIGAFSLNHINNGMVKIGCHTIALTEAIEVFKTIGVNYA